MRLDQLDKPAIVKSEVQENAVHPKVDKGQVSASSGINSEGESQGQPGQPGGGGKLSKILELIEESQKKKEKLNNLKKVEDRQRALSLYSLVKENFDSLDLGRVLYRKV